MSKRDNKSNGLVNQIFDDLEQYRNFCRDYGYRYDESELYSNKSHIYRQFTKFMSGKPVKDMWELDSKNR
jgi:hypothetical protein